MSFLKERYTKEIAKQMVKEFSFENVMEVPRIKKVCINAGIGPFRDKKDDVESFAQELSDLAGQKSYVRKAKLSEAGFKIKKGDIVGFAVTLRGDRMWSFLEKLTSIVMPRIRDFRGLPANAFDKSGNYSIGVREHTIFPEVNPNIVRGIRSLQITLVFNNSRQDVNLALLKKLGFIFKEK